MWEIIAQSRGRKKGKTKDCEFLDKVRHDRYTDFTVSENSLKVIPALKMAITFHYS